MKLATTFCLAVLSLAGCATDDGNSGSDYLVMRSTKVSADPLDSTQQTMAPEDTAGKQMRGILNLPADIRGEIVAEEVNPDFPIEGVCEDCLVTFIRLPKASNSDVGEIRVVSDGGMQLCTIFLDPNGGFDTTDCNP